MALTLELEWIAAANENVSPSFKYSVAPCSCSLAQHAGRDGCSVTDLDYCHLRQGTAQGSAIIMAQWSRKNSMG